MLRQTIVPVLRNQTRLFATTPAFRKGPIESAKDAVKAVDRTVSDVAVSGIEKGQQAKESLKESVSGGKAEELKDEAKGKAKEMASETKGKAAELKGEAKGKAEEIKGKM